MKKFVVRQTGTGLVDYVREFKLEVPDEWTESDVQSMRLDEVESEDDLEWKRDYVAKITVEDQRVSPADSSACRWLPHINLQTDVNLEFYRKKAEAKRSEAQSLESSKCDEATS